MDISEFQKSQMMEAILGSDSEMPFKTFLYDRQMKILEAESMFKVMKEKDPESLALKLADYLGPNSHHDLYYREKCAKLLKELLLTDDTDDVDLCTWRNLSVSTQSTIKCTLLDRMKLEEESGVIMYELSVTVIMLAASLLTDHNWPEFLPFLCQCVSTDSSSNDHLRWAAFYIYRGLAHVIGESIVPFIKTLHSLFHKALNGDTLELKVRSAATAAAITFVQHVPASSNEKERFQDLLPGMMKTLTEALSSNEEGAQARAQYMLLHFIALAKNEPRFFRWQLVDVVNSMLEIAEDRSFEEFTRDKAIEFLLTLVEAKEKAPGMMKKVPRFTNNFFAILLDLLLDIKDEPSWHSAEQLSDEAGTTVNFNQGRDWLRRFCIALGGKTVTRIAIEQLGDYLVATEWEKRHAALIALVFIARSCSKVMIKYLEQVIDMVLRSFQDPHPRVRFAAIDAISQIFRNFRDSNPRVNYAVINTIGPFLLNLQDPNPRVRFAATNASQISVAFRPQLQEQYHKQVSPALAAAMNDFQNPRIQAVAATVLRGYCGDQTMPDFWVPYLDGILNILIVLLQNGNQMVQEEAVSTLGSIAESSMGHFQQYYDFVMPYLKTIMVNANDKCNHMLLSKTLLSISSVAVVSKDKFRDDLKQVMEMLESLQKLHAKEFDTIYCTLLACGNICEWMGKDFLPYMSTNMPLLVACAQLEPDKTVSFGNLSDSIQIFMFGDEIIRAKGTDIVQANIHACAILRCYAIFFEEDFYPWISQVASILVPVLKFHIYHYVRREAISAMCPLLRSAKLAVEKGTARGNESYFEQLSGDIILAMGDALYSEPETQLCAEILKELNICLRICGLLLNEDQVHSIIDGIKHVITESSNRKRKLKERAKLEDFDAEEDELLREEKEQEDDIIFHVGFILQTLIKTFKGAFLPFFDELSPYLIPMWGQDMTVQERRTIGIICDLLDECPEAALKYFVFVPSLLEASNDEDPGVRQTALYGLVLYAEYGGSDFKPFVREAISRIYVVIMHYRAREPENEGAYDNAVSALGKICQFHRESVDSSQVIPIWLNCLPIKCDLDEAKYVHDELCSMVERLDIEVIGPNYQYIPKIISVFAEVLCSEKDLATKETVSRIFNVLRHLQQTLPPTMLESTLTYLLPQQEMELKSILSREEDDKF